MVRQLREARGENGLVLANGGVLSHHHAVCLSRSPRKDKSPYPARIVFSPAYVGDEHPPIIEHAEGLAIIEVLTLISFSHVR